MRGIAPFNLFFYNLLVSKPIKSKAVMEIPLGLLAQGDSVQEQSPIIIITDLRLFQQGVILRLHQFFWPTGYRYRNLPVSLHLRGQKLPADIDIENFHVMTRYRHLSLRLQ